MEYVDDVEKVVRSMADKSCGLDSFYFDNIDGNRVCIVRYGWERGKYLRTYREFELCWIFTKDVKKALEVIR